jgi:hypothetical protein
LRIGMNIVQFGRVTVPVGCKICIVSGICGYNDKVGWQAHARKAV